jgi:hypothetical protein
MALSSRTHVAKGIATPYHIVAANGIATAYHVIIAGRCHGDRGLVVRHRTT